MFEVFEIVVLFVFTLKLIADHHYLFLLYGLFLVFIVQLTHVKQLLKVIINGQKTGPSDNKPES